jgi:hypothetical protein
MQENRRIDMTRFGMVFLGLMAAAAGIAVAVAVATGTDQPSPRGELTPAQVAELRAAPEPAKARSTSTALVQEEDEGGAPVVPHDEPEDGPGS